MGIGRLLICALGAATLAAALLVAGEPASSASVQPSCAEGPEAVAGTIYGTPCDDHIAAPPGVAAVAGGGGDDTIVSAPISSAACTAEGCFMEIGSQTFEGGPGNDVVFGERGNDRLFGGEGDDQLFGGIGDDLLDGGAGNDRVSGGFGADSVEGGSGNDYVRGDATADPLLSGGPGSDTVSFSTGVTPGFFDNHGIDFSSVPGLPSHAGERGLYLDLADGVSDNGVAPFGGGIDQFVAADFETVIGTPFSDYIEGTSQAETIYGGGGGDVLIGEEGNDVLYGGADGDDLDGGPDVDSGDGNAGDDHCDGLASESNCESGINGGGVKPRDPSKIAVGMLAPESTTYEQLYVAGSAGTDRVTATYSPGSVTFVLSAGSAAFDTSDDAAAGCGPPSSNQVVCPLVKPLDSIVLAGLDGDDTLAAPGFPASVSVVVAGGEGGDALTGGDLSEDVLADGPDEDGPGKDVSSALGRDDALLNNGGKDNLNGGTGNDLFLSDSICDGDELVGGPGRDNASWAKFDPPGDAGVAAGIGLGAGRLGAGGAPDCGGGPLGALGEIEDLEGSPGADAFYGDGGENQLLGWAGEDIYSAGAGKDRILANSGDFDPTIACGPDADTALIDFPQYGDVAAGDCEDVREAKPNSFRIDTLPPLPPVIPEVAAPVTKTPPKRSPSVSPRLPLTCLARSAAAPVRCGKRPRRVGIGALGLVDQIKWRRWGARRAIGFGRLTVSGGCCEPGLSARAKIRVGRRVSCNSRRWYTRLTVTYGKSLRKSYVRRYPSATPCD